MKKVFALFLSILMVLALAACHPNNETVEPSASAGGTESLDEVKLKDEEAEFSKVLEPVSYREGEQVQSAYYKTVVVDGENFYEVQPVEEEPLRMPVNETVIYGIDSGDCTAEKICLKLSNGEEIIQYRLYVMLESGTPVDSEEPAADVPAETDSVQASDKIS